MTRTALFETHADDHGCGCVPAPAEPDPGTTADIMQARAIAGGLAEFGIGPRRWSAAYDHQAAAVVLRVDTPRGLYALAIPAPASRSPSATVASASERWTAAARTAPPTATPPLCSPRSSATAPHSTSPAAGGLAPCLKTWFN